MNLRDWLIHHEGLKQFPYVDTVGKMTIGVGRNLVDRGLTIDECYYLLENDIKRVKEDLSVFSWYTIQPYGVQEALENMCFNLGLHGLLKFKNMIESLKKKDYKEAAAHASASKWASQVPRRASDVIAVIRAGK